MGACNFERIRLAILSGEPAHSRSNEAPIQFHEKALKHKGNVETDSLFMKRAAASSPGH